MKAVGRIYIIYTKNFEYNLNICFNLLSLFTNIVNFLN